MVKRTIKEEDFGKVIKEPNFVTCENVGGKCNICGRNFFPGDLYCKGGHKKGAGYSK